MPVISYRIVETTSPINFNPQDRMSSPNNINVTHTHSMQDEIVTELNDNTIDKRSTNQSIILDQPKKIKHFEREERIHQNLKKKYEDEFLEIRRSMNQINDKLTIMTNLHAELSTENQTLREKNLKLEESYHLLEMRVTHLEQNLETKKESTSMEIEEKAASLSELATKEYFNELEDRIQKLSITIKDESKKNMLNTNETMEKIDSLYKKTNKNLETLKQYSVKKEFPDFEKKISNLDNLVKKICEKIKSLDSIKSPKTNGWENIMNELKDVKQHCNDWDSKILHISDTINTKVLPNIEKANRKAEGASNRVESFFKFRSNNKYLKGEEQRGIGINVEALERELYRKEKPRINDSAIKFIPFNRGGEKIIDGFQEGKHYNILLEMGASKDDDNFFREVYVEHRGKRKEAKLYISKIRKNSTEESRRALNSMSIETDECRSNLESNLGLEGKPLDPNSRNL